MPSLHRKRLASIARIGVAWAALCVIALASRPAQAQAPAPGAAPAAAPVPAAAVPAAAPAGAAPAGGIPGQNYYRVGFLTLDQLSFSTHPFFQITGSSQYDNAKGAPGSTFSYGAYESDANAPVLVQLIHSLPPFYLEGGRTVDAFLPKAVSVGFDSFEFSQSGSDAGGGKSAPSIKMDMWIYQAGIRGYAFDPTQPGINAYLGFALGFMQGNLTASPPNQSSKVINFNQFPTGGFLFGIDLKGDNFGLRYEVNIFSAREVAVKPNPYGGPTTIDFSGSLVRGAIFYQF